jgi:hypothetical protein
MEVHCYPGVLKVHLKAFFSPFFLNMAKRWPHQRRMERLLSYILLSIFLLFLFLAKPERTGYHGFADIRKNGMAQLCFWEALLHMSAIGSMFGICFSVLSFPASLLPLVLPELYLHIYTHIYVYSTLLDNPVNFHRES